MKMTICSIRDSAAQVYGRPFFTAAPGAALRSFADMANEPKTAENVISSHPEDFELFELGTFDDQTCEFDLLMTPRSLATGKSVLIQSAD